MPNIAAALKDEIARIARKEMRAELLKIKTTAMQNKADIAALKKQLAALEQQGKRTVTTAAKKTVSLTVDPAAMLLRFSAKGLASQRRRLGLNANDMGALLGVSGQTVYKWEEGKARPRASQMQVIAGLRGIGKREAAARLLSMQA
jgi:DNA-binding transcriptional regulator YiaG